MAKLLRTKMIQHSYSRSMQK